MNNQHSDEYSDSVGGTLLALRQIQSLGDSTPFRIVPVSLHQGSAMPVEELMAAKVRWAAKAGYSVLTQDVPLEFYPYNAVIRVDERGTEDRDLDYLARIAVDMPAAG
jgi:hypothetical protein